MKIPIFIVLTLSLLFSASQSMESFAQEKAVTEVSIWAPGEMLAKQEYYGIIVLQDRIRNDIEFDIITDNEEALKVLTEKVVIERGEHHGIIKLETINTGTASLYAIHKDVLIEVSIDVKESAATPTKIDLILPTDLYRVLADDNKNIGYVFLLNDFDDPVLATKPIPITITSNDDLDLENNMITIEPGSHYGKFEFIAGGDGDITASGPNLEPDDESINTDDTDDIELVIEVAPDPLPTYSSGEIYFWLERDDKPFIAPHDIKVTISIDKPSKLSFDPKVRGSVVLTDTVVDETDTISPDARYIITKTETQLARESEREYIIEKGSYYGRLTAYASFNEEPSISISGVAESINPPPDEEEINWAAIKVVDTEQSNFGIPTDVNVFAYPDPGYRQVEIVVSSQNSNGPVIERDDESIHIIAEDELLLDNYNPKILSDQNYAIVTSKVLDTGEAQIFAERNEAASDIIEIELESKYVKDPELEIVPFPVIFGVEQDLFLVTASHDKIRTESDFEKEGNVISITSKPSFPYQVVREGESVLAIRGVIDEVLEDDPEIFVASSAETVEDDLEVYNPDRKRIESFYPPAVFPNEPFPIVNHITDLNNHAITKAELRVSSSAEFDMVNGLAFINQTGEHGLIFYDRNSVPIEATINVGPIESTVSRQSSGGGEPAAPTIVTYEIIVENGQGSGTYQEGEDVTISAEPVIDDNFITKKVLVGWEGLPYTDATATFEADEDIVTSPIYQDDYTMLIVIISPAVAIAALIVVKTIIKKRKTSKASEEGETLEEEEIFA